MTMTHAEEIHQQKLLCMKDLQDNIHELTEQHKEHEEALKQHCNLLQQELHKHQDDSYGLESSLITLNLRYDEFEKAHKSDMMNIQQAWQKKVYHLEQKVPLI